MINVFRCSTLYHLLLSYLIITKESLWESSIIIESMSKSNENVLNVINNFKSKGLKTEIIIENNPINRRKRDNFLINKIKKIDNFRLYNFRWNVSNVYEDAYLYCKNSKEIILVEDGMMMYSNVTGKFIVRLLKNIFGYSIRSFDRKIRSIYVSDPSHYASLPQDKIERFHYVEILDSNSGLQNDVKYLFEIKDNLLLDNQNTCGDRRGVIFTQPLFEDGYMSRDEKIAIYTKIVDFYKQYGLIYLKVHPRDLDLYENIGCTVFGREWPSELLDLIGMKYDFAIGICTSAIMSSTAKIKINLNENFLHDGLLELVPLNFE